MPDRAYLVAARTTRPRHFSHQSDRMLDAIARANSWLNGYVWGIPMLVLLMGTGVLLLFVTGGVQFRHIGTALGEVLGKLRNRSAQAGNVTPFQAVATALEFARAGDRVAIIAVYEEAREHVIGARFGRRGIVDLELDQRGRRVGDRLHVQLVLRGLHRHRLPAQLPLPDPRRPHRPCID